MQHKNGLSRDVTEVNIALATKCKTPHFVVPKNPESTGERMGARRCSTPQTRPPDVGFRATVPAHATGVRSAEHTVSLIDMHMRLDAP